MKTIALILLFAFVVVAQTTPEIQALRAKQSELRRQKIALIVKHGWDHADTIAKEAEIQAIGREIDALIDAARPKTDAERDRDPEAGWRELARTAREPVSYWFYKDYTRTRTGDAEVWLKYYDVEGIEKARRDPRTRGYTHQMQFTIFHCRDRRVSVMKDYCGGS